jgi:hypothetical protein
VEAKATIAVVRLYTFTEGETTMRWGNALTSIAWGTLMKKFAFLLLMTAVIAHGQASRKSKSDAGKTHPLRERVRSL